MSSLFPKFSFVRTAAATAGRQQARRGAAAAAALRAAAGSALAGARVEPLEERRLMSVSLVSANGNGASTQAQVSADGRYVVFASTSDNLAANDANALSDVFLRNTQTGETVLISQRAGNTGSGNAASTEPSISADGRFVAFTSGANDLIASGGPAADTNGVPDIYMRDWQAGTTIRVSADPNGQDPNRFSAEPYVSANGDFVVYNSLAFDLVSGVTDANAHTDVFLRNVRNNTTTLISSSLAGPATVGNGRSYDGTVSTDGRYVAFRSDSSDLVANDTNGHRDIFLRDTQAGTTTLVSVAPDGTAGDGPSNSPTISADGRYVAFSSRATNLVGAGADTNAQDDVFLRDTQANTTTLLSVNLLRSGPGNGSSVQPSISTDGRVVAFSSSSSNLIGGDANNRADIFLRDLTTGAVTLLSTAPGTTGGGNGASVDPYVSADGRFVVFNSTASDLAAGDANGLNDVFLAGAPTAAEDAVAPTAALASTTPDAAVGADGFDVIVNYADNTNLNLSSFGDDDIVVTGPNGFNRAGRYVGPPAGGGQGAAVTYRVDADGPLGADDNGAYLVRLNPGSVTDAVGNGVAGGDLGTLNLEVGAGDGPDLVTSLPVALPSALAGSKAKKVRVLVTNQGNQPALGKATLNLFLSADSILDANDARLFSSAKKLKLKAGASKLMPVKFTYPASGAAGTVFVLSQIDAANVVAESREANNISANPVVVAPAFNDLAGSFAAVSSPITRGGPGTATLLLKNGGNVPLNAAITVRLFASPLSILEGGELVVDEVTVPVKLKAGATKAVPFKFNLNGSAVAGQNYFIASIDFPNQLAESDEVNNTVVSSPVTFS
jgi:Tol biopolymer transport system component